MAVNTKAKRPSADNRGDTAGLDSAARDAAQDRSYYYDDAHGYEVFDPEAPDNDDDETEEAEPSLPSDRC